MPLLQRMLDHLPDGQKVALASKQIDELFGLDDVRASRLKRFADAHRCLIIHADSCVVFEKAPSAQGSAGRPRLAMARWKAAGL